MPATVTAERVERPGSITWFRANIRQLRTYYRRPFPTGPAHLACRRCCAVRFVVPASKVHTDAAASDVLLPERSVGGQRYLRRLKKVANGVFEQIQPATTAEAMACAWVDKLHAVRDLSHAPVALAMGPVR